MVRPPEFLKSFADRLAQTAASEAAEQLVRMLTISGLTGDNHARPDISDVPRTFYASEPGVPPQQSRHIGIWERQVENGKTSFMRRLEVIDHWHFWANVGRIEPKSTKLRVLFIGESVARGYLYDPSFTPAMALQMILDRQFGKERIEVIDLARTNLGYEVRELALAALQLEPDAAIIFAGNNWGFSRPAFDDIAEIDRAIATEGMVGVKRVCDRYIARAVKTIVSEIAAEYKKSDVPLTWIIPEFNLADWRGPFTNAPYLPGNANWEWIAAMNEARTAFSAGDLVTAEQLAARIVELDHGTCAAGYYILADCRRLAGDTDEQRRYLELARDAQSWDSSVAFIPKPYAVAQQILREELPQYGVQLVDLPAIFKEYLKGGVPDRRLFMDYCHFTSEGIRIAMALAASCVLRTLKGVEQTWETLACDDVAPSAKVEAEASFLAAVHSAHHHQRYELVHHFCARALKYSAHVAEIMLNYIDLQLHNKAPLRMSEAEIQIFHLGSPLLHRYLFQKNNPKWFDKVLLTALVDALEEAGVPARERLERLYREEHSPHVAEIDLLEPFYYQSAGQPHEFEALCRKLEVVDQDAQYFRAYWPESKFVFAGAVDHPVNLSLTCRLPKLASAEGQITVACNDEWLADVTIAQQWSAWEITVPGDIIRDGINEIELSWPMPEFRTDEALSDVVVKLCQQKYPEYYPIFGEIHSFTASDASPVSNILPPVQVESSLAQVA
jgi:hypothetical protein